MTLQARQAYLERLKRLSEAVAREVAAVSSGQATLQSYSNALSDSARARRAFIDEKWANEKEAEDG